MSIKKLNDKRKVFNLGDSLFLWEEYIELYDHHFVDGIFGQISEIDKSETKNGLSVTICYDDYSARQTNECHLSHISKFEAGDRKITYFFAKKNGQLEQVRFIDPKFHDLVCLEEKKELKQYYKPAADALMRGVEMLCMINAEKMLLDDIIRDSENQR